MILVESPHPASLPLEVLREACEVRRQRRSGPGGQHRNKVETAIIVIHNPTNISAEASEKRSQADNQKMAFFRLRVNLALRVRSSGLPENLSDLWQARVKKQKIAINPNHEDFPSMLANAIDYLFHLDWDLKKTTDRLTCSSAQFVKLLKLEPRAFLILNQQREKLGLFPLK